MLKKDLDARGEEYTLNDNQKTLEDMYQRSVTLLIQAGFKAEYKRLWTWESDSQPGYISLTLEK